VAQQGMPPLEQALANLSNDIRVTLAPIELMRG